MTRIEFQSQETHEAVLEEATHSVELLPTSPLDQAARDQPANVSQKIKAQISQDFDNHKAPSLYARKSHRGFRPLTLLTLVQRTHLRGLVNQLKHHIPAADRDREAYENFALAPTQVEPQPSYVVMTDVVDFYHYIDHEALALEIVRRSGQDAIATDVTILLNAYMGRSIGLPQTSYSSDYLSEIYIDAVSRRMLRAGWNLWRYNDDFRITANSWLQAQAALEDLVALLQHVGLTINEGKTYILRMDTYNDWLGAPGRAWEEAMADAGIDPSEWDTYGEDEPSLEEEEDGESDLKEAAVSLISHWERTAGPMAGNRVSRLDEVIARRLLGQALVVLGRFKATEGLNQLSHILLYEPQLTPRVARYMNRICDDEPGAVSAAVGELATDVLNNLPDWQSIWLLEPFIHSAYLDQRLQDWADGVVKSTRSSLLRARAGLALASEGKAGMDDLLELYEVTEAASRPVVVAAIAMQDEDWLKDGRPEIYRDDSLSAIVADWVESGT